MFNGTYSSKARHVVHAIEICADRGAMHGIPELNLSHVEVFFLPLNKTSLIHLLDTDVIVTLKGRYRGLEVGGVLESNDFGKDDNYKADI